MSTMKNAALTVCTMFVLLGCSSTPIPEQHLYLLNAKPATVAADQAFNIGISTVTIAAYLRRSELLVQVDEQEIRPARYHGWAEPLTEGVKRYMRDALSGEYGSPVDIDSAYRSGWSQDIAISIDQLHGDLNGQVYLDATYTVAHSNGNIRRRFTTNIAQGQPGYAALVEAQQTLLDRLAVDISRALQAES